MITGCLDGMCVVECVTTKDHSTRLKVRNV